MAPVTSAQACWICGAPATSGEHGVKRTDLKAMFPDVSSEKPLFLHPPVGKVQKVQGINSDALKLASRLCAPCNNARTQPHDKAWDKLAPRLRSPGLKAGDVIHLGDVFPGVSDQDMIDLQLYFAKLTGCLVHEDGIPIDLPKLANAILSGTAHPDLYLRFGCVPPEDQAVGIFGVEMIRDNITGRAAGISWFYNLGTAIVHVILTPFPGLFASLCDDAWRPGSTGHDIVVHDYAREPEA